MTFPNVQSFIFIPTIKDDSFLKTRSTTQSAQRNTDVRIDFTPRNIY